MNLPPRVGACPTAQLCFAGARLHLGTQGQMPPAFLVLHALMRRCLDCPRRLLDATPAALLAACWRIQSGFPSCALPGACTNNLPVQVVRWSTTVGALDCALFHDI